MDVFFLIIWKWLACFVFLQVLGVAVFFALLLKPVAVEETEEIEQVFLGKKKTVQGCTNIGIVGAVLKSFMLTFFEQCFIYYV